MKSFKLLITFFCFGILSANAQISITWATDLAMLQSDSTSTQLNFLSENSLFALYYVESGELDFDFSAGSLTAHGSNVQLLLTANNPGIGGIYTSIVQDFPEIAPGGLLHSIVFDVQDFQSGVTDVETYAFDPATTYYVTPGVTALEFDELNLTTRTTIRTDLGGTFVDEEFDGSFTGSALLIPEPGTLMLVGIAGVTGFLAMRRRRKKALK